MGETNAEFRQRFGLRLTRADRVFLKERGLLDLVSWRKTRLKNKNEEEPPNGLDKSGRAKKSS